MFILISPSLLFEPSPCPPSLHHLFFPLCISCSNNLPDLPQRPEYLVPCPTLLPQLMIGLLVKPCEEDGASEAIRSLTADPEKPDFPDRKGVLTSAIRGLRDELRPHVRTYHSSFVQHYPHPTNGRDSVRIWICSSVDIFEGKKFTHGDTEQKFSYGRKQLTIGGAWVGKTWIDPMGIHHKVEICCASCGRQSHGISPRGTTTYIGHVLNESLESSNGAKYVHVETDRLFRVIISLSLRILCERHCSPVFTDLIQQGLGQKRGLELPIVGMCLCFLSFCFPSFASMPPLSQIYTLHSVATLTTDNFVSLICPPSLLPACFQWILHFFLTCWLKLSSA